MPAEEKRQPFVRLKEVVEFSKGQTEFADVPVIEVRTSVENATELKSIRAQVKDVGVTLVPTLLFIASSGYAKLKFSVAKGKKLHDKRQSLKDKDISRDLARMMD